MVEKILKTEVEVFLMAGKKFLKYLFVVDMGTVTFLVDLIVEALRYYETVMVEKILKNEVEEFLMAGKKFLKYLFVVDMGTVAFLVDSMVEVVNDNNIAVVDFACI